MEDEDTDDVLFWLDKSISERLAEVSRLRKNYFLWSDEIFPEKIEKVVHQRKYDFRAGFQRFYRATRKHQVDYMIIGAHALPIKLRAM